MASNIKGITIEIGGDTTELSKALTKVNGSSRSLQSELKQVDKLLKFDSGNVTLCAQKQRVAGNTFTQNVNITSNRELSPAETARQTRIATRQMIAAIARG